MKKLNKTYLPYQLEYNGQKYERNYSVSAEMNIENKSAAMIEREAKLMTGAKNIVLVSVLSKNLKDKTDLHGKEYQPTRWIFTPKK